MKVKDILVEGYYDVEKDRYSIAMIDDTRRPRFTLEHLNKLRKVREFFTLSFLSCLILFLNCNVGLDIDNSIEMLFFSI